MLDRTIFIDSYNMFIRNFQVCPILNDDGDHFGAVFGYLNSLKYIISKFKPSKCVICWDGVDSGLRRRKLYPEYKATRKDRIWKRGLVRAYDFLSQEEEQESFRKQIRRVKEYLQVLPIHNINIPYVEADDIIAICVIEELQKNKECIIISTDKDYIQLCELSNNVICFNPITKKENTKTIFNEINGFLVDNYIVIRSIEGDASDNIKGVIRDKKTKRPFGIKQKTIIKLFPNIIREKYNIERIIEEASNILQSNTKGYTESQLINYETIVNNSSIIKRNYKLMQLLSPDVDVNGYCTVIDSLRSPPNNFDKFKLRLNFVQDKIGSQLRNYDQWILNFIPLAFYKEINDNSK